MYVCRCMYVYIRVRNHTLRGPAPSHLHTSWELWLSSSCTEWTSPCQLLMNTSLPQWGQVDRPSASVAGHTAQTCVLSMLPPAPSLWAWKQEGNLADEKVPLEG